MIYEDQLLLGQQSFLRYGMPNQRYVLAPRVGTGVQRVDKFYADMLKALTAPLTAKEKESGKYEPAPPARIAYEGNINDAQAFFQKTTPIELCGKCPIANWTDGLPIIVPTEEKVKEILMGTSHKPDEQIFRYSMNATTKQIQKAVNPVNFSPMSWTATVEKVAVNAVMAGCKPEYLPVVLAIASTGPTSGSTHFQFPYQVVSGPIAKEIGMNSGIGIMGTWESCQYIYRTHL